MKIKFKNSHKDQFYTNLKNQVSKLLKKDNFLAKAKLLLWIKLTFYFILFLGGYIYLLQANHTSLFALILNYILVGLTGILLAFNAAHDAAHSTFSRKKWVNDLIYYLSFNLQGVNAYLWKIRHIDSHHLFANVDGCDADIDDNFLIKFSPKGARRSFHKYQHIYATPLYCIYTLHWIFIKDFIYLKKTELANLKDLKHPPKQVILLYFWKGFYLTYMLLIPFMAGYAFYQLMIAFLVMHFVISLFFVWTLIISHLTMETDFPVVDEDGLLPYNFAKHQLAVSMDYYPKSNFANWIFGGFNSHAAHHLFPNLPHTTYTKISKVIEELSATHQYPYNKLPIPQAIYSHYQYLKKVGNSSS